MNEFPNFSVSTMYRLATTFLPIVSIRRRTGTDVLSEKIKSARPILNVNSTFPLELVAPSTTTFLRMEVSVQSCIPWRSCSNLKYTVSLPSREQCAWCSIDARITCRDIKFDPSNHRRCSCFINLRLNPDAHAAKHWMVPVLSTSR